MTLSAGARRLWDVLHRLTLDVARVRGYPATPDQVTFHCPAVSVAAAVGYTDRYVRTLVQELERVGLLDAGGHAQKVGGRNLYDGTLWSVKTRVEAAPPRVRADEWRHAWRPGFADDYISREGAAREISELVAREADHDDYYRAARNRAAVPDALSPAAAPSPEQIVTGSLKAVVEALPGLWRAHPRRRPQQVGRLAAALCAALQEPERRRYWCRELWRALRGEQEQRGALQVLATQIARLAADIEEGAPWVNPGAVLAARLR